jgi:hypothetical protein
MSTTTENLTDALEAAGYDAFEYAHDRRAGMSCIRINLGDNPALFILITDAAGCSAPYDPEGEAGEVLVYLYDETTYGGGATVAEYVVEASAGQWPTIAEILAGVASIPRYRYAVGVDSAWNAADIHDDPADAITHAIAAAAERAARGEDDAYPVAVYLIPRNA